MPRYVVLLRGINVGKNKRVPMAEFRDVLLELGCTSAKTLRNSGNAVVDAKHRSSAALAKDVAAALLDHFDFEVPVVARSAAEFAAVVDGIPFSPTGLDPSRLLVVFGQTATALDSLRELSALVRAPERFSLTKGAGYLYCANGILDSEAGEALLGPVGKACTSRNWSTVVDLHELASA